METSQAEEKEAKEMSSKEPPMTRKYYLRWLVLVAILISSVTFTAVLLLNQPLYGMCPNRQFKVSHVYLPNHDQVISENSRNFFYYPYNEMGDVIPKDQSLFIAFSTSGRYGRAITFLQVTNEDGLNGGGIDLKIDNDISILFPLRESIERGEIVHLTLGFLNSDACFWSGVVG